MPRARRFLFMIVMASSLAAGCSENAIIVHSPAPRRRNCIGVLQTVAAGTTLDVQTTTRTVRGRFVELRGDGVAVLAGRVSHVELAEADMTRVVQFRGSHTAKYAKRGLLFGIAMGVLTAVRSHASVSWAIVAVLDAGAAGAGIGAAAGASAHDALLLCGSP